MGFLMEHSIHCNLLRDKVPGCTLPLVSSLFEMVDANMPCEWRFGMGWKTRDLQAVACSEWGLGSDNSQYRPETLQKKWRIVKSQKVSYINILS